MFMKSKFWIVEMPKYSIVLFCLLNIVAMYLYSGGSIHNKEQIGYVFTKNFFSDLGTTVSYSGAENMVSCILFNISLCICGFTFIMLFYKVRTLFKFKGISFFATLFGVLGGICFIGVAFTPANLLLDPHILFAHGIFRCLLIASILYSVSVSILILLSDLLSIIVDSEPLKSYLDAISRLTVFTALSISCKSIVFSISNDGILSPFLKINNLI